MTWTLVLIGFAMAVFVGSALVSLLVTIRPEWSERRKRLTAASALPAITVVATLIGILFIATSNHGESEHVERLAINGLMWMGGGLTLLSWIGGLVGATLTSRRRHK